MPRYASHSRSNHTLQAIKGSNSSSHHRRLNPTLAFPLRLPILCEPGVDAFLEADTLGLLEPLVVGKGLSGSFPSTRPSKTFSLLSSEQTRLAGRALSSATFSSDGTAARPFAFASWRPRPVKLTAWLRSANCVGFRNSAETASHSTGG